MEISSLDEKLALLSEIIKKSESAVIAFSGGVDSSVICAVSREILGDRAVAVTALSQTYPPGELKVAQTIARKIGIKHLVIRTQETNNPLFLANPSDRCYHCKAELIQMLEEIRAKLGFRHIFDGTNSDDYLDTRPGLRALSEYGVFSPLAEAGMTKEEVRRLALRYGLPNADKPANPCLASRIPFGQKISKSKLDRIAKAEEFIRSLGFRVVRVRDNNNLARVEVGREEVARARRLEKEIASALKGMGYSQVVIDPRGYRSGGANL